MKGKLVLFLFALPFFGVGVWMGYSIAGDLVDAWQMQKWTPVEAELRDGGYHSHDSDDGYTYEAYARYRYSFAGVHYENDRVAIAGGADNIGDFQRDLGQRLSAALRRGGHITVYVNPGTPAEAVVDRSLRWGLIGFKAIFFLVFGGVGTGLIIWAFMAPREKELSAPGLRDSPWLANDDWQSAVIRSGSRASMWFAWGFALLWNLISAPLPFLVYEEVIEKHNLLAVIGLLFPLVGLGLLVWAIRRTREWHRFGPAPVTLDPFPGSIGGNVGGRIDVRLPFEPSRRFAVTLTSLFSHESGSGDNRSRRERADWQDKQVAHATAGPYGTRLSFRFDVPDDLHASDAAKSGDAWHLWRLNLRAELPGADIDRDYEIPVYPTRQKSRGLSGLSIDAAKSAQKQFDLEDIRRRIRLSEGIAGKSMLYPAGRYLSSGLAGCLFGAIFTTAGWFLLTHEGATILGSVFGMVGLLIMLSALYFALNSLEILQDGAELKTIRRIFAIPIRQKSMRRADFVRFSMRSSMSTQSGGNHVMYYSVFAHDRAGQKLTLGEGFQGASQAEAAIELIAREFGLSASADMQREDSAYGNYNLLGAD